MKSGSYVRHAWEDRGLGIVVRKNGERYSVFWENGIFCWHFRLDLFPISALEVLAGVADES